MMLGSASAKGFKTENQFETQRAQNPFEFALIGDVPYGERGRDNFPALIADINNENHILWVMHAGDTKNGSDICSDELLEFVFDGFQSFNMPVIYTPGDNEWTDCHRIRDDDGAMPGDPFPPFSDPLERLAKIREVYFPTPGLTIGGEQMPVTSQANYGDTPLPYPENVAWVRGNVVFAALHIVGSDDGMRDWVFQTDEDNIARMDEVIARREANLVWLDTVFEEAKRLNSPGLFLMIHADPRFEDLRDAFLEYLFPLRDHTNSFDGQVVVALGDSHLFRVDKNFKNNRDDGDDNLFDGTRIENFTRVETFGSVDDHWVRVMVDPASRGVFLFEPVTVEANKYPIPDNPPMP